MINIKKYIYSSFIVYLIALAIIMSAWLVSLQLTKLRVQLEGNNKLQNIQLNQSPFVWDFVNFENDVVESFQHYWQYNSSNHSILATKASNPQLSLNFSGETINTRLHNELHIQSYSNKKVSLQIQFKTKLDDNVFYYSPKIVLDKTLQIIDLNLTWQAIVNNNKENNHSKWGGNSNQMSSLVLLFKNPESDLSITKITLPFNGNKVNTQNYKVNCDAKLMPQVDTETDLLSVFKLSESCFLPSTYMWLKQILQQKYPQSILLIESEKPVMAPVLHKINYSYTSIVRINTILYVFIALTVVLVLFLRKKHTKVIIKDDRWYHWFAEKILFKSARKAFSPYHLVTNYTVVLIPTFVLVFIMMLLKFPDIRVFKQLPLYFLWALVQQYVLGYLLAQRLFYNRTQNKLIASVLAALLFSVFHLPSVALMLSTFIAGCLWAYAYLVFKRLIPLALSHSLLALMFYFVTSDKYLYSAKVLQWFWE